MIPDNFKPMLAINHDKVKVQPRTIACSEKLDGVRVVFFDGVAYSRTLKPIPNKLIQKLAAEHKYILEGCDGECIAGDLHADNVLQRSTSFCMKADNTDDFCIYLFDKWSNQKWIYRYQSLCELKNKLPEQIKVLDHFLVRNAEMNTSYAGLLPFVNLELFEQQVLEKNGEGVMLRDVEGSYKYGRSATNKPELQKIKRFQQEEFVVVGYNQLETNQNELQRDERGYAMRSTSKEGKQLVEALGGLVLALPDGRTFNAGSGFTQQQRLDLWCEKDSLCGRLASVQFFGYSYDGVPLLPVFKAFRSEIDV